MRTWYGQLQLATRAKLELTCFKDCIENILTIDVDGSLYVLVQHWWDTTHTYLFKNVGEMKRKDFAIITTIPSGGFHMKFNNISRLSNTLLRATLVEPIERWIRDHVLVNWIYDAYCKGECLDGSSKGIVVMAFILMFIGANLFVDLAGKVSLQYMRFLKNLSSISAYNWANAVLVNQYHEMDDLCRGVTNYIGGMCYAWKVKLFLSFLFCHDKLQCVSV